MAAACAHCGSTNTQALADKYQCLDCGNHSDFSGEKADPGPNQTIKDNAQAKLDRGREVAIVGNLADLQVAGGAAGPDTVGGAAKENAPGTTGATAAGDDSSAGEKSKGKK